MLVSLLHLFPDFLLGFLHPSTSTSNDKISCIPTGPGIQGFSARFFPYPIDSTQATDSNFYIQQDYMLNSPIGASDGIIDPNYYVRPCIQNLYTLTCPLSSSLTSVGSNLLVCGSRACQNTDDQSVGNIDMFGFSTTVSNITVELSGYLYTPQTGNYVFSLNNIDDAASITVGSTVAFDCCAQSDQNFGSVYYSDVISLKPSTYSAPTVSSNIFLRAGNYYPVKIVYVNMKSVARLGTSLTLPDGTVVSNWGSMVYSYMDDTYESSSICIAGTDFSTNGPTSTSSSSPLSSSLYSLMSSAKSSISKSSIPSSSTSSSSPSSSSSDGLMSTKQIASTTMAISSSSSNSTTFPSLNSTFLQISTVTLSNISTSVLYNSTMRNTSGSETSLSSRFTSLSPEDKARNSSASGSYSMSGSSRSVVTLSPSDMMSGSYTSNSSMVTDSNGSSYYSSNIKSDKVSDMSYSSGGSDVSSFAESTISTLNGEVVSSDSVLTMSESELGRPVTYIENTTVVSIMKSISTIEIPKTVTTESTMNWTIVAATTQTIDYDSSINFDLTNSLTASDPYSDSFSFVDTIEGSNIEKPTDISQQSNIYNIPSTMTTSMSGEVSNTNMVDYQPSASGIYLSSAGGFSLYHTNGVSSNTETPYTQIIHYSNSSLVTVSTLLPQSSIISMNLGYSEASIPTISPTSIDYAGSVVTKINELTTTDHVYTPSTYKNNDISSTFDHAKMTSSSIITAKLVPSSTPKNSFTTTEEISTSFIVSKYDSISFSKETIENVVTISFTEEYTVISVVPTRTIMPSQVILSDSSGIVSNDENISKSTPISHVSNSAAQTKQHALLSSNRNDNQYTTSIGISENPTPEIQQRTTLSGTQNLLLSSKSISSYSASSSIEANHNTENYRTESYDYVSKKPSIISLVMASGIKSIDDNASISSLSSDIDPSSKKTSSNAIPTNSLAADTNSGKIDPTISIEANTNSITMAQIASSTPIILSSNTNSKSTLNDGNYPSLASNNDPSVSTYHGSGSTLNINYIFSTILVLLNFMV
ncbi:uncharacterized protein KABA2_03S14036 [Maudiozyma barnettii]|uniref:Similar to Saccharomyces cerevisiae YHR211W FLO5 Lectin-like cell wall protein (Flocculin) involved in flocculation n=1 Tax=Maudiozyma barnettii TaxID=61262 RepID=A0A8H2VER7_9SACH|nr:uncharacterized protein KABA2_03S14036 [Kazachstania barnettii]CAB4254166.1 similar to Saccharomyces cerevisiae YHR211W FLO5 Lectin-like cell wall protein (flocculin) involved in flocculation [Kazachstania barnettii]